jgi:DNA-binding GntR family transcriptional regulator
MSSKPVNLSTSAPGPRPGTRYSTLARLLTEEIESGRYKVGEKIPTEAELQQRFDVSRHTVREALRDLKGRGLVLARAGVGTVVRAHAPRSRFMQGVGTFEELIQFFEATRMRVLKRRRFITDDETAERLGVKPGQEWLEASVLRFLAKEGTTVAAMSIYVRPEHGDVLDLIDTAHLPVFSLIERRHGVRITEVSQQIIAVTLDTGPARALKARAGTPALEITRRYTDAQDRLLMGSVGLYPSDRFSHNTKFRIQTADSKENA